MTRYDFIKRSNLLFTHKTVAAISLSDCVSGLFPADSELISKCVKRYKAYCRAWEYVQSRIWENC